MTKSNWDENNESDSGESGASSLDLRSQFDDEDEEEDYEVLESWSNAEESDSDDTDSKSGEPTTTTTKAPTKATSSNNQSTGQVSTGAKDVISKGQASTVSTGKGSGMSTKTISKATANDTEAKIKAKLMAHEKQSDLENAQDLFGDLSISSRTSKVSTVVNLPDSHDKTIDLSSLPLFKPKVKEDFSRLRSTLESLITPNSRLPLYPLFAQEVCKDICNNLTSEQIKKVISSLTALSNAKLKEEKAADKGNKKSKAAKTKVSLTAPKNFSGQRYYSEYDDNLDE